MGRNFDVGDAEAFLRAVDRHLEEPARMVVIGGMALALGSLRTHTTSDLDFIEPTGDLLAAIGHAQREMLEPFPVQVVGSYFAPQTFEDRLERADLDLAFSKLQVLVPERHDLALMKLARGDEHDLQALEALHQDSPFSLEILIERFRETWTTGRCAELEISFLGFVERIFGAAVARSLDGKL